MTKAAPVLLLSLAANVALGAWLLLSPVVPSAPVAPSAQLSAPRPATPVDQRSEPITTATWSRLTEGTPADYAARLRAEGLPPAVVRALVRARIASAYSERLKALRPSVDRDEYWRRSMNARPEATMTAEARAERRQIDSEIATAVKAATGADYELLTPRERAIRERRLGPLSTLQANQVAAIETDYNELRTQVRERTQGVTLPEDRAQLRLLEQEQRADLAAVLTPAELLEYDLRNGDSVNQVRMQTRYFEPTEAEYRAMVQLRLEFNRQYGTNLNAPELAQKNAAEPLYEQQVRSLLTPERAAEYDLTANRDFRHTAVALAQFNFDVPVAREVMTLRRAIAAQTAVIQDNKLYSDEQRAAALAALYREASSQLTTRLGAKAYQSFERDDAGAWLRDLQPKNPAVAGGTKP